MPVAPPAPVLPGPLPPGPLSTSAKPVAPGADRIRQAARQFDAVFMTEMLRHARPQMAGHGRFATGQAEKSWQVFMDQALGEAAAAKGGSGLEGVIEKSLRAAAAKAAPVAVAPGRSVP